MMSTIDSLFPEFVTIDELLNIEYTDELFLVENLVPKNSVTIIAGKGGDGKSTFCKQLGYNISNGSNEFFGFKLNTNSRNVLYVCTEDWHVATKKNTVKLIGEDKKQENKMVYMFPKDSSDSYIIERIKEKIKDSSLNELDLIVIDVFGDVYPGEDFNNSNQMRKCAGRFEQLAKHLNCAIMLVHHLNKKGSGIEAVQGGSGLQQKARSVMIMSKSGDKYQLKLVKSNYAEIGRTIELRLNIERMSFSKLASKELIQNNNLPRSVSLFPKLKEQYHVRKEFIDHIVSLNDPKGDTPLSRDQAKSIIKDLVKRKMFKLTSRKYKKVTTN